MSAACCSCSDGSMAALTSVRMPLLAAASAGERSVISHSTRKHCSRSASPGVSAIATSDWINERGVLDGATSTTVRTSLSACSRSACCFSSRSSELWRLCVRNQPTLVVRAPAHMHA